MAKQPPSQTNKPQPRREIEVQVQAAAFTGPIPPPHVLAAYDQIQPGIAVRILAMAESQQQHREQLEKTVVQSNAFTQRLGPILGFIVVMTCVLGGLYLIIRGLPTAGLTAIISSLAALAAVFVYGRMSQVKERAEKADALNAAAGAASHAASLPGSRRR